MSLDSQMLIDGEWTAASSGATSNAFNPATGGVITTFPEASIAIQRFLVAFHFGTY